ncbi:MAG: PQQ-binding-like beta-propeller repeat protein [Planctomycetota bacterium]|nr:PQQ-binding-like beta-propeller repeat protein [Planctomycetota bacterium]
MHRRLFSLLLILAGGCTSGEPVVEREALPHEQLITAARDGDQPTVGRLLDRGVAVNAPADFGVTALWQACRKRHQNVAKMLLRAGADPNVTDAVWETTPLWMAEDPELIQLLVRAGARDAEGKLRAAAFSGSLRVVDAILDAGTWTEDWLISAKANALLANRQAAANLLDRVAGRSLPEPTPIPQRELLQWEGTYQNARLQTIQVEVMEGTIGIRLAQTALRSLAPRNRKTFDFGASTCRFEVAESGLPQLLLCRGQHVRSVYERATPEGGSAIAEPRETWRHDTTETNRAHWDRFRGPDGRGITVDQNIPDEWDVASRRSVVWKTNLPGLAHSSPIVWGQHVFVTTAETAGEKPLFQRGDISEAAATQDPFEHAWKLICLDHATGAIRWQHTVIRGIPNSKRHPKSSQANSTPATNGEYVVALFNQGSLCCYTMDGRQQWQRDLGIFDSGAVTEPDYSWGFASSPVVHGERVFVQCDLRKESYLVAYDLASGKQCWKIPRDEVPSWSTPVICKDNSGAVIVTAGSKFVRAYDVNSGSERWRIDGLSATPIPSPFAAADLLFLTSGHLPTQPILVIQPGRIANRRGQRVRASPDAVVWSRQRGGSYIPTPIVYGDYLYTCSNRGILTCYQAQTGVRAGRKRIARAGGASFSASPVATDGRIFLTSEAGFVHVVRAGPDLEILATNRLGDDCLATPAIAGGLFLVRTRHALMAIGRSRVASAP